MPFASLGLSQQLVKTLDSQNFKVPYPIQKEAIPAILQKKDVLGIAKTGSGKTAGYVLPILMNRQGGKETRNRTVDVLVLVPTRELAVQVAEVFNQFGQGLPDSPKVKAVFGGVSINPQMKGLMGVSILVATPGRLLELIASNAVSISHIDTLVLDEADKMLNLGFKDDMDRIIALLPRKRQNLLFSATLSADIQRMNQLLLNNPLVITIDTAKDTFELIHQSAYFVTDEKKGPLLRALIKSKGMRQVLVFTSSIYKSELVAHKLTKNGIEAEAINSDKSQKTRTDLLTKFKQGFLPVLVTTDLLARGIDIEFLPYVINYELPRSPKDYIHRIGRTGRAESPGEAISLISPAEEHHFKIIQKKMGKMIPIADGNELL